VNPGDGKEGGEIHWKNIGGNKNKVRQKARPDQIGQTRKQATPIKVWVKDERGQQNHLRTAGAVAGCAGGGGVNCRNRVEGSASSFYYAEIWDIGGVLGEDPIA